MAARTAKAGQAVALIAATLALASLSSDAMSASSRICRQLEAELARAPAAAARRRRRASRTPRSPGSANSCSSPGVSRAAPAAGSAVRRQRQIVRRDQPQDRKNGAQPRSAPAPALESRRRRLGPLARRKSWRRSRPMAAATKQWPSGACRVASTATRNLFDRIFGGGISQRGSLENLASRPTGATRNATSAAFPIAGGMGQRRRPYPLFGASRQLPDALRAHLRRLLFPDVERLVSFGLRARPEELPIELPGTEVQIYYHRSGRGVGRHGLGPLRRALLRPPDGLSLQAARHPEPGRLHLRRAKNDGPKNFGVVAGNPPAEPPVQSEPVAPYPSTRPDSGADPETLANLDGGLDAEALRRMAVTPKVNKRGSPARTRRSGSSGLYSCPTQERQQIRKLRARTPVR